MIIQKQVLQCVCKIICVCVCVGGEGGWGGGSQGGDAHASFYNILSSGTVIKLIA